MGGKGNARYVLEIVEMIIRQPDYRRYFEGFDFPYGFLGAAHYQGLLDEAGFEQSRVELIDKDMEHDGSEGLKGWIRTTWLPYTGRIEESERDRFIDEIAARYLHKVPLDAQGKAHVAMVRLEVEARKPQ